MAEGKLFIVWHYSRSRKKECLAGTLLELKILGCSVLGLNASPNDVRVKGEEIGAEVDREDVFQAIMRLPKLPEFMLLTGEQSWLPRPPPWLNLSKIFERAVPRKAPNAAFLNYEKAMTAWMETSRKRKKESGGSDESCCRTGQLVSVSDDSMDIYLEDGVPRSTRNRQRTNDSDLASNFSGSTQDRSRSGSCLIKRTVEDIVLNMSDLDCTLARTEAADFEVVHSSPHIADASSSVLGSEDEAVKSEDEVDIIMEPRGYQVNRILGQLCSENIYMRLMRLSMLDLTPDQLKELIAATPRDCPDYPADYLKEMQEYASSMLIKTEALFKLRSTLGKLIDGIVNPAAGLTETLNLKK